MATQQQATGSFVQTTQVWDVARLYEVDVTSTEFKELLVRLYQQVNNIAVALNTKKTAYYLNEQFNNGSQWFNPLSTSPLDTRAGFTKVIDTGALGAGATVVAHGITITATTKFTHIYGSANDNVTPRYYPIPFIDPAGGGADIAVQVNATNVIVTNNTGTNFTSSYIILEFLEI